ncbi:hypothetical protein LEMLEM_LOCUS15321 [Lemmus lemmus]
MTAPSLESAPCSSPALRPMGAFLLSPSIIYRRVPLSAKGSLFSGSVPVSNFYSSVAASPGGLCVAFPDSLRKEGIETTRQRRRNSKLGSSKGYCSHLAPGQRPRI